MLGRHTESICGWRSQVSWIFFCLLFLFCNQAQAQAVATANVLQRVFELRFGEQSATCFAIEIDDRQYLITAKHAVTGIEDGNSVAVFNDGKWKSFPVRIIRCADEKIDIVALVAPDQIANAHPISLSASPFLSQDVFFFGFPLGLKTTAGVDLNRGFPFPFVKKGILSGIEGLDGKSFATFWLDAHANRGFSGGPVVIYDGESKSPAIIAVVSSFRNVREAVVNQTVVTDKETGKPALREIETGMVVKSNTGLVQTHSIKPMIEAIRKNPIGAEIRKPKD